MIFVILCATESSPFGKITLDAGVFICSHFKDGGSPPNICAFERLKRRVQKKRNTILLK